MTRRERKEAKLGRRLDWAASRDRKANAAADTASAISQRFEFGQPILVGHHSERKARRDQERMQNLAGRAVESHQMAEKHRSAAAGLQHQLDTSIFSDDPDAPEALARRIADLEAKRDRMKAVNKEIKRGEGWAKRLAAAGAPLTDAEIKHLANNQRFAPGASTGNADPGFQRYEITNLGGNINRLKKRLAGLARPAGGAR